ncbi:MAG: hypothetical protein PVG02_03095 [Anaerolineales bacterium]|jgi:hypothetical protein
MEDTATQNRSTNPAPLGVKLLSVVLLVFGLLAFFGSLLLWGQGSLFNPPGGIDLGLPVADLLINAPASILAAVGLWRLQRYGYVASQFVAGFYIYASVEIFVALLQNGAASTGEFFAILIPQLLAVLTAVFLVFYLWRIQDRFSTGNPH